MAPVSAGKLALAYFIVGYGALQGAFKPVYICTPFVRVFGSAALHALAPHGKAAAFHRPAHQVYYIFFGEAKLGKYGFKGSSVFPGHFNYPVCFIGAEAV